MIYIHNVPCAQGINNEILKMCPDSTDEIRKALSTIRGIGTVDINLNAGSILVHYNPKVTHCNEIAGLLERRFDHGQIPVPEA